MTSVTTTLVSIDGKRGANNLSVNVNRLPSECPLCHKTIVPDVFFTAFGTAVWLEVYLRCVSPNCLRAFIALYKIDQGLSRGGQNYYSFERCVPTEPHSKIISPDIADLSPSFVKIFAQALSAEDHGLEEIAGPGYRKALEFLIKDYAISLVADDEAKADIKKVQLGTVITKYLSGDKLPIVSKRAAWLGNDETHYERRWIGKDLQDLKKLIEAVEHFIAMEKLVATLPAEMPDPKSIP